jgi:hypothetical protein
MKNLFTAFSLVLAISISAQADTTQKGKIVATEGHIVPSCRTVVFKENATGIQKAFRILDAVGEDDVSPIVLTALVSQKDVTIFYEPTVTSGCGTEPRIGYITIYN